MFTWNVATRVYQEESHAAVGLAHVALGEGEWWVCGFWVTILSFGRR